MAGPPEGTLRVEALGPQHDRNTFASGVEPLDRYFRTQTGQDTRKNMVAPFVLVLPERREEAFRNLKGDLAIRPVFHQDEKRIEAQIFIAFLAYCMQIILTCRLHALAPGLTARSALEKFAAVRGGARFLAIFSTWRHAA